MKTWMIAAAALGLAGSAWSQTADGGGGVHQACRADVDQYCGGVTRGGGRIRQCMVQHHDQLSTPCKAALASARASRPHPNSAPESGSVPPS